MLTGYNTDIKHEGVIYHVQTEDGGTENPVVVSLIYRGGRILASKKTSYTHLLGADDLISQLRTLLENQHRAMIKAILTGTPVTGAGEVPAAPSPVPPPSPSPAPAPDPGPSMAQVHPQPAQSQGETKPPTGTKPPSAAKPPLEIPPEGVDEAPAERTSEKNLDQVILEYLASEIDKD